MSDSYLDKRRSVRGRRLLHALCIFNNGSSSLDVTVRDLSESGARLVSDGLYFLPPIFDLRIREADGRFSTRRARMVWTHGRTAGLEFIA